jgi:hypothetical protein
VARTISVEYIKLFKAIKVVEKVLKAFLKAMTYYQMTNSTRATLARKMVHGTTFLLKLHIWGQVTKAC